MDIETLLVSDSTPSFQAARTSGRSKKAPRLLQCGQNSFGGAAMKSAPGFYSLRSSFGSLAMLAAKEKAPALGNNRG